ncbi:hypothetical protein H072_9530 [Dactylellina haptotyla CBS 200.50]|uniref:Uncharacterized protein n=1 Tax=Dactylellina haptotyla (strain CBS 200.50) TaxID=1284197 RepID=S8BP22_DACHA|nr:hypothetical protein H072_9530 [Dactylellina haptotyla CBS 200.50]
MKITIAALVTALAAATSVVAHYDDYLDRGDYLNRDDCPPGYFQAIDAPGHPGSSCVRDRKLTDSTLPRYRPYRSGYRPGYRPYNRYRGDKIYLRSLPTESGRMRRREADEPKSDTPKFTPKEWALMRAKKHNATAEQVKFLDSIDDATYKKMSDVGMKLYQARKALWAKEVPKMDTLPTPFPSPGSKPAGGKPHPKRPEGYKLTRKDRFIRWASLRDDVSSTVMAKIKETDASVFDDLRKGSMRDRFVKEAELIGKTDLATWFKSSAVPDSVFKEIETLRAEVIAAHADMKAMKKPTL